MPGSLNLSNKNIQTTNTTKSDLQNFDMYKYSDVKIELDTQCFTPDIIDFDFSIIAQANDEQKGVIEIYNLAIDRVSTIKIYCNDHIAFALDNTGGNSLGIEMQTNEVSTKVSIAFTLKVVDIENLYSKGDILVYTNPATQKPQNYTLKRDYLFNPNDSVEAKIKTILKNEDFQQVFYLENKKLFLLPHTAGAKSGKTTTSNHLTSNIIVLNEISCWQDEELTLIAQYTPNLIPLGTFEYSPIGNKGKPKTYTLLSCVTTFKHDTGLIQILTLKTGERLKAFLNKTN